MRIQVLGLCRFSYLVEGGFQSKSGNLETRRAQLYAPARLTLRILWFEHVFLPAIRAQTDPDFTLIVLTGEDFPEPWRGLLQALTGDVPQIRLVFRPVGRHREACRAVMREHVEAGADVVAQFRLDDDDAVAVDYVESIRTDFTQRLRPLYRPAARLSLDYAKGLVLAADAGEVVVHGAVMHNATPGLTIFLPPDDPEAVLDFPHHILQRFMPGVGLAERVMYVRGMHGTNDSGALVGRLDDAMAPRQAKAVLARRFRIDLARFIAELGAVRLI